MADQTASPRDPTVRIEPLDRASLERLAADAPSLAAELPAFARPHELAARFAETGLLGPRDSVWTVSVGEARFAAEAWTPDEPAVATTLRLGLAPLGAAGDERAAAAALAALVDHLFRTTAVARVERCVAADDAGGAAACRAAGLELEGPRRRAGLSHGRLVDVVGYAATRDRRRPAPRDPISRIGVLTGGGDAPGLNAVLRAVVKTAAACHGWEVLGIEDGFEGLVGEPRTRRLTPDDVRGFLPRGGTVLGSASKGRFRRDPEPEVLDGAIANLERLGVDALVAIGGDGTQTIAAAFAARGVAVVGVPKTIDNDLEGTDLTFGFNTALELATDAIDRLHTTAESHDRVLVLEVMGRTTGWIALHAAVAGGADVLLIPEIPFSWERVAEAVLRRERAGRQFSIVVAAEGAAPAGGHVVEQEAGRLGGIGSAVADEISRRTGKEARVAVLGHLQRGGRPTAGDRLLATAFGAAAVRALAAGERGRIVALRGTEIVTVEIAAVAGRVRRVPLDSHLLATAAELGVELGAELGGER